MARRLQLLLDKTSRNIYHAKAAIQKDELRGNVLESAMTLAERLYETSLELASLASPSNQEDEENGSREEQAEQEAAPTPGLANTPAAAYAMCLLRDNEATEAPSTLAPAASDSGSPWHSPSDGRESSHGGSTLIFGRARQDFASTANESPAELQDPFDEPSDDDYDPKRQRPRKKVAKAMKTAKVHVPPELEHCSEAQDSRKHCNCKKSRCLKLYCECFKAGAYCDGCACLECLNTEENVDQVAATRETIKIKAPDAFECKVDADNGHKKGCNCTRSQCRKKYCECFQAGVLCTDACKCDGCLNCLPQTEDQTAPVRKVHRSAVELRQARTVLGLHDSALDHQSAGSSGEQGPFRKRRSDDSAFDLERHSSKARLSDMQGLHGCGMSHPSVLPSINRDCFQARFSQEMASQQSGTASQDDEPRQARPSRRAKVHHDWAEELGLSKNGPSKSMRGPRRGHSGFQAYKRPGVDSKPNHDRFESALMEPHGDHSYASNLSARASVLGAHRATSLNGLYPTPTGEPRTQRPFMVHSIPVPRLADRFAKDAGGPGHYGESPAGAFFPTRNKENTVGAAASPLSPESMAANALLDLAP